MDEKVKKIMAGIFEIPMETISDDASPDTLEQWDSLHHLYLVLALEENFGISFSEEEIVEMLNLKLILLTLKEKIGV
jgi:acyl carrier protein